MGLPSLAHGYDISMRLMLIQDALPEAMMDLIMETPANHGGYIEQAADGLNQATVDVALALAWLRAHPEASTSPDAATAPKLDRAAWIFEVPTFSVIQDKPPFVGTHNSNPHLREALLLLTSSLQRLTITVPTGGKFDLIYSMGEMGGYRDKLADDLRQAAQAVLLAYDFAHDPVATPKAGAPTTPEHEEAAVPPAASLPDTALSRLENLQTALTATLAQLPLAPDGASGEFIQRLSADIKAALVATNQALVYVRTHPEANGLTNATPRASGPGGKPPGQVYRLNATVSAALPGAPAILDQLSEAYSNFMIGPAWRGGPLIGPLDGNRAQIIYALGLAMDDLQAGPGNLSPKAQSTAGAITGVVLDPDGNPAANVLIGLARPGDPGLSAFSMNVLLLSGGTQMLQLFRGGRAAALTDEKGAFSLRDLPPGNYVLTAHLGGTESGWEMLASVNQVQVKVGATTPLSQPVQLRDSN